MLGRAVKDHSAVPSIPKPGPLPTKQQQQNGNIQDKFNQATAARQPSKSIGGFTGYRNSNLSSALQSAPSNNQKYSSSVPGLTSSASTLSSTSSGLQRVLSKSDAFSNAPDRVVDLTRADSGLKKEPLVKQHHVVFDENDFDDDLDLDEEYDIPFSKPKATFLPPPPPPPRTMAGRSQSDASTHLTDRSQSNASTSFTSSAQPWSSSPPSHRLKPPAAEKKKLEVEEETLDTTLDSSQPIRAASRPRHRLNPRVEEEEEANQTLLDSSEPIRAADQPRAKRRTLPWAQKRAEEAAEAARLEEIEELESQSFSTKQCVLCGAYGHYLGDCNAGQRTSAYASKPPSKNPPMPWNTTASKIAQDKRELKDKQLKRKAADADLDSAPKNKRKPRVSPVTLSEEQQRVLDLVVNQQKSVFFTGSAGTGKSVLMRAIIGELRKKYKKESDRVAVTASTGLAACNIGGITLHSFGGIGLGKEDVPTLVRKIKRNAKAKNRWLKTKILVIDEISMVDGDLFDKLEGIARMMRNNGRPFGGIQLVITGDFFQLPPVPDYDNKSRGVKFAFDASTWPTAVHHTIGLTQVFRQKDPVFANMLNEMRLGKITDQTVQSFRKMSRKIDYNDSLDATELFPTRNEVENANSNRMRGLAGTEYRFEAIDTGTITDLSLREKLLANMMAPKLLTLKKGSQVMLIKNMDDGLVNGSLGKVIAFMDEKTFNIYDENQDILDENVASQDLHEDERNKLSSIKKAFSSGQSGRHYPLVRFSLADGTNRDLLVQPEEWKVELPNGEVQAQRSQIPLILAWALSIHKAQGQTLDRVKIDLKRIFEKGQAYVALSRATSLAGLEVLNFDKSKVMAHPRVGEFYDSLYSVNKALQHPKVAPIPQPERGESYEEKFRKQGGVIVLDDEERVPAKYDPEYADMKEVVAMSARARGLGTSR